MFTDNKKNKRQDWTLKQRTINFKEIKMEHKELEILIVTQITFKMKKHRQIEN